jgi:diacylglycerol kinase family enzyme
VVAQINYPSFKHNTQDSIKQARGRSHEEGSSHIFMLDDMQFEGGVWMLSRLKQKKIENYQAKLNKIKKLPREQTLVASTHPPIEIRTDHGNETSIYIMNTYLFLTLVS